MQFKFLPWNRMRELLLSTLFTWRNQRDSSSLRKQSCCLWRPSCTLAELFRWQLRAGNIFCQFDHSVDQKSDNWEKPDTPSPSQSCQQLNKTSLHSNRRSSWAEVTSWYWWRDTHRTELARPAKICDLSAFCSPWCSVRSSISYGEKFWACASEKSFYRPHLVPRQRQLFSSISSVDTAKLTEDSLNRFLKLAKTMMTRST